MFKIETFGFIPGGIINITVNDFSITDIRNTNSSSFRAGFILRKSASETASQQDLEIIEEEMKCILDAPGENDLVIDFSNPKAWKKTYVGFVINPGAAGLYTLIFARCRPAGPHYVNFKLLALFHNPGPNYLSAGDAPLPTLYFSFFLIFTATLGVWSYAVYRPSQVPPSGSKVKVHSIHYLMTILLILKALCLLFESIRFHYIAISGFSDLAEAWSIVYYIFTFLKGIMLFTVILLIGSGWSLMKVYLHDREKRVILVVLTLQVIDNIAMIVLEETAPGSQGWLTWRDILHLVDVICCCAILFPIVWSIRHLRQAAEADGKAQNNIAKLTMFRQFYVSVVVYIYFTRIVVFLLSATIPFYLMWLGPMFNELATLVFFVVTGYRFRPASDNPYLPVRLDDDADPEGDREYGLKDEGLELPDPSSGRNHLGGL